VPVYFSDDEFRIVEAACARLIPTDADPGASEAGVAEYIDGLLGAFLTDPPRIWAGGPVSGRAGGDAGGFAAFCPLSRLEELAWRIRIEGSAGRPEREFNGPVVGLQQRYRDGLDSLGADFADLPGDQQDARLRAQPEFCALLYDHACEGMYAAPEYGGNRHLAGWGYIDFEGDVQPRGYTDDEVSQP
jgi:hypothetical protein